MGSAIIGGIVGVVLASALRAYQEHRRARLRVRTAARLLLERFEDARKALDFTRRVFEEAGQTDQPAPLFRADYETPEWAEVRVVFAERLDSEAFAVLVGGVKAIAHLAENASRFEQTRGAGDGLLRMSDLDGYEYRLGRPIALLGILAEDRKSPIGRLWERCRRKPTLATAARDRFLTNEIDRIRQVKQAGA